MAYACAGPRWEQRQVRRLSFAAVVHATVELRADGTVRLSAHLCLSIFDRGCLHFALFPAGADRISQTWIVNEIEANHIEVEGEKLAVGAPYLRSKERALLLAERRFVDGQV